jgi:hypothetical protein
MFKNNQTLRKFVGAITLIALAIIVTTMAPLASASSPKAIAQEPTAVVKLEQPSFNQSLSPDSQQLAQLTSVTQFTDVKSNEYYYQALQNLVERWGCIGGYPDGTFRAQQPLTRGDFVAMLDACLNQVQFLIQQSRE